MTSSRGKVLASCAVLSTALVLLVTSLSCGRSTAAVDTVSGATSVITDPATNNDSRRAGVLIILSSSRNSSTAKIADAIAKELDAKVLSPQQVKPAELQEYDVIGFGSGIFDQMHHKSLLDAADRLPRLPGRKVFIFSTSGISRQYAIDHKIDDPHTPLRDKLRAKGCTIIDEFNCAGFNNNSFLKLFGGMNKGRPNEEDIKRAVGFAERLRNHRTQGPLAQRPEVPNE
jgi:flavodoxin